MRKSLGNHWSTARAYYYYYLLLENLKNFASFELYLIVILIKTEHGFKDIILQC